MNYILFDDASRNNLLPLSFTRPIADIRIGILTIREKWEKYLNSKTSSLTEEYLSEKFPIAIKSNNYLINSSIFPNEQIIDEIHALKPNQALSAGDYIIAYNIKEEDFENIGDDSLANYEEIVLKSQHTKLNNIWDIFVLNGEEIAKDFELLTKGRKSVAISTTNKTAGEKSNLY